MAPLDLEGGTLGNRHQHYNKLLKEAIANRQQVSDISLDDTDVENLLKIDLACHKKDVDYIISVLKSRDMLYVSRALAQSTWLVTDPQYAHIINPDYLHTHLLPYMSTQAFIKLNKHIRLNIQDESRAEQFYLKENKPTDALKWLPLCSVTFIETKFQNHTDHCKVRTFKRLCEKSNNILEIALPEIQYYDRKRYAQAVMFLLKVDVDKFLDVIEKTESSYSSPKFNDKATDFVMNKCPKRIIEKFDLYADHIHIPTFSKYIKTDEIKPFIYAQAKKKGDDRYQFYRLRTFFMYNTLKYLIKRLPKSEQFDFVKQVFIDKENMDAIEENLTAGTEAYDMKKLLNAVQTPNYVWYRFASFERAFEDITRIISKDLDNKNKAEMLSLLISCADNNTLHLQTLLKYYLDKHKNEQYRFTLKFTTELFQNTNILKHDKTTWNLVNELVKLLKVYDECNDCQGTALIIESIIVYNLIHDQSIPAVVQKQFSFQTLISYENKLTEEQKQKIFSYLYEFLKNKLKPIAKEEDLTSSIDILKSILQLLRDWKKELDEYNFVTEKIKECVKIKKEKEWKDSLLPLYNFNKSWKKYMFEESITMNPCEEVCLNALKHDPQLLQRHDQEVEKLRTNNSVSLQRLLAKLRTYWPHSLAQQWTDAYLQNVNKADGHKATIRGICMVLPKNPLIEFIDLYKPAEAAIDWNNIDDRVLSIQRFIAKNMHIARPQPCPDTILGYAKGDYLQFALPSLLSIFYNLNITESKKHIPKLLDARVSLQKHGIRLAFQKLDHIDIKKIFFDCWNSSKNKSIRAIIFKFTFELLTNEKDPDNVVSLWELIELFIDNLTFEEDKNIYEIMSQVHKIPRNVRPKYLMKSYKFLKTLTQKVKEEDRSRYEVLSTQLADHTTEIMEDMCPAFVTAIIQDYIDKDFFGSGDNVTSVYLAFPNIHIQVISAYLLCAKNESIQSEKYHKVFCPIMHRAFANWSTKRKGRFIIREQLEYLLTQLSKNLKDYVTKRKMIIPVKIFINIENELEKNLAISENYRLLTMWKLTVTVAKLINNDPNGDSKDWDIVATEIAPEFGKICLTYLKEDVKLYFPSIYKLFSIVLNNFLSNLFTEDSSKVKFYESMLADKDFVQGYLTTIENTNQSYSYDKSTYEGLWNQIFDHPSVEVKMHYYYRKSDERQY